MKFFDFIVPIIPYINPSNSYTNFLKLFKNYLEVDELKKSLLRNVSYSIDDYRLLTNIYNEYLIYRANVFKSLDKNKLVALIVYKNIHPQEFSRLHTSENKDAILKKIFSNKENLINDLRYKINIELEKTKTNLELVKDSISYEVASNIRQLKFIYLFEIVKLFNNNTIYISINNNRYQINNLPELLTSLDDRFEEIKNYGFKTIGRNGQIVEEYSFEDFQKRIYSHISYSERKQSIEDGFGKSVIQPIESKLADLEKQLTEIESKNISQLIKLPGAEEVVFDGLRCDLTKYLVRNGFIDENYNSYMSYFFEGGLSHKDVEYSLKLDSQILLPPDTKVPNARELIYVLDDRDFFLPNILNYDVSNSLIAKKLDGEIKDKYSLFLKLLSSQSDRATKFVFSDLFLNDLIKILPDLAEKWSGLWDVFIKENPSQSKVEKLLSAIVNELNLDVIDSLNINNGLTKQLELISSLSVFNPENNHHSEKVLDLLNIKFVRLIDIDDNYELFQYIYKNKHFECFPNIVKLIFRHIANNESLANNIQSSYLSSIYKLDLSKLIIAFEEKINYYIEYVAFSLTDNSNENSETLVYLLNHDDVDIELKKQFFSRYHFKLKNIDELSDERLWTPAIENNSIAFTWNNLYKTYIHQEGLTNSLIEFINTNSNNKTFSEKLNTTSFQEVDEESIRQFATEIIENNEISDNPYSQLVPQISINFENIEILDLSSEKISILIKAQCFSYSKANVINLGKKSKEKVDFLYHHIESFSKDINEEKGYSHFEFTDDDYYYLLKDKRIDAEHFEFFVNYINFEDLNINTINNILKLILSYRNIDQSTNQSKPTISINYSVLHTLIDFSDELSNCLEILILNINKLSVEEIKSLLSLLPDPYFKLSQIQVAGKKNPILEVNENNAVLLELLKRKRVISSFKERNSILNKITGNQQYIVNLKRK
nr:hypothetical protein [Marinicella sp. NBU2979]